MSVTKLLVCDICTKPIDLNTSRAVTLLGRIGEVIDVNGATSATGILGGENHHAHPGCLVRAITLKFPEKENKRG